MVNWPWKRNKGEHHSPAVASFEGPQGAIPLDNYETFFDRIGKVQSMPRGDNKNKALDNLKDTYPDYWERYWQEERYTFTPHLSEDCIKLLKQMLRDLAKEAGLITNMENLAIEQVGLLALDLNRVLNSQLLPQLIQQYAAQQDDVESEIVTREKEQIFHGGQYVRRILEAMGEKDRITQGEFDGIMRNAKSPDDSGSDDKVTEKQAGETNVLTSANELFAQCMLLEYGGVRELAKHLDAKIQSKFTAQVSEEALLNSFEMQINEHTANQHGYYGELGVTEARKLLAAEFWGAATGDCSDLIAERKEQAERATRDPQGILGKSPGAQMAQALDVVIQGGDLEGKHFSGIAKHAVDGFCRISGITKEISDPDKELELRGRLEKLFIDQSNEIERIMNKVRSSSLTP